MTAPEQSLTARITAVIADQCGIYPPREVAPEMNFVEDLYCDSLDLVELVMALEEEFDVQISDDEAERLLTVADVISYIESKVAA